jgi:Nucleoside 2-deoxyribosyltransferase like
MMIYGPSAPRIEGYVEAPNFYTGVGPALFLAGGITGCPDWQAQAVPLLRMAGVDWTILNPRRPDHTLADPAVVADQIAWEYRHLLVAQAILFWFPRSSLVQPIALYELGATAVGIKPLAVGADPGYPRRLDVILQLAHARPGLAVRDTLDGTVRDAAHICW